MDRSATLFLHFISLAPFHLITSVYLVVSYNEFAKFFFYINVYFILSCLKTRWCAHIHFMNFWWFTLLTPWDYFVKEEKSVLVSVHVFIADFNQNWDVWEQNNSPKYFYLTHHNFYLFKLQVLQKQLSFRYPQIWTQCRVLTLAGCLIHCKIDESPQLCVEDASCNVVF